MAKDIHTSDYKQLVSQISSTFIRGQQKEIGRAHV
jgi:hypothetical protein